MTSALATEADPFVLPMPGPDSPVVQDRWISPDNTHLNSRYSDDLWSLGPLTDNPGHHIHRIIWSNCPAALQQEMRLIIWTLINGELRPSYVKARSMQGRARDGVVSMRNCILEWLKLARWLHQRGVNRLRECTTEHWKAFAAERTAAQNHRGHALKLLRWLTDLWAFDQLSAQPSEVIAPPWETDGIDDYLPADTKEAGGENTTEPVDPAVIGPLLTWPIRLVENCGHDILAAWTERRRMIAQVNATDPTPETLEALKRYLLPRIEAQDPLPAMEHRGHGTTLNRLYIAAVTGAAYCQTVYLSDRLELPKLTAQRPGPCPMQIPVTGLIDGRPWREHLDFEEAPTLVRHLATAAAVVIMYLTGMRPQEARTLRSGCCPDPEPGSTGPHLIRAHHYKNVRDIDGHHVSAGAERDVPWVAIAPVVKAIRILERMVPEDELLFSSTHHDVVAQRKQHGALKASSLDQRVEQLIGWINTEAVARGLPHQRIPDDPLGNIGLSRLRRTLAWHIARRPGGLVALAIQYGHMRTVLDGRTASGYGSRARRGFHGELDVETALAAADTAARLRDATAAGAKISGPAARRALVAAAQLPRFEGALTTPKAAAKFLSRDGQVLFDNPDSFLICAFKRDMALCDPDSNATAPNQFACQAGCGNAVRTDSHARAARAYADALDLRAAHLPEPAGKRLRLNAIRFRNLANTHDAQARNASEVVA
ncbi:integrase [Nocardia amamiensis]|uniref:Integrase n=1 Tax=Nocardia amamiensis TaxID=404578 RepID=A0ABS0D1N1_9NOCA|nr:integrase [Nocardia amamiensis]MBF6302746.1 integrase [Nocardia amamiensis]